MVPTRMEPSLRVRQPRCTAAAGPVSLRGVSRISAVTVMASRYAPPIRVRVSLTRAMSASAGTMRCTWTGILTCAAPARMTTCPRPARRCSPRLS
jgi:hypothetical protein